MKKSIPLLQKKELVLSQKKFPLWMLNTKQTHFSRTFLFNDHLDALVFIARVTVHAQICLHHPDILFTYKKVKVTVSTDEVKGITKNDIELLKRIETLKTGDKQ